MCKSLCVSLSTPVRGQTRVLFAVCVLWDNFHCSRIFCLSPGSLFTGCFTKWSGTNSADFPVCTGWVCVPPCTRAYLSAEECVIWHLQNTMCLGSDPHLPQAQMVCGIRGSALCCTAPLLLLYRYITSHSFTVHFSKMTWKSHSKKRPFC